MSADEWAKLKAAAESGELDHIVHNAASRLAFNANNAGVKAQLEFLTTTCCWSEAEVLKALE